MATGTQCVTFDNYSSVLQTRLMSPASLLCKYHIQLTPGQLVIADQSGQ